MAATVKVPGLGEVPRNAVLAGAGVTAGIIAFAYWRSSTAAPATSGDPAADLTGLETPGSLGDGALMSDTQPASQVYGTDTTRPTTLAQWAQLATAALGDLGWDPKTVATALGKYIAGQALTNQEADIAQTAVSQTDFPYGFPVPAIRVAPTQAPPVTPKPKPVPKPVPKPAPKPAPKPPVKKPQPAPRRYTIKRGDTLSALAKRFRTTVAALAKRNKIKDPDRIYAGQTISY